MEFYIGQVFEGEYPPEAASWCNSRGDCFIETLSDRRFRISRLADPTPYEIAQQKIEELKLRLSSTDYVAVKIAEGSATRDEYANVIAKRQIWREEIRDLEKVNG